MTRKLIIPILISILFIGASFSVLLQFILLFVCEMLFLKLNEIIDLSFAQQIYISAIIGLVFLTAYFFLNDKLDQLSCAMISAFFLYFTFSFTLENVFAGNFIAGISVSFALIGTKILSLKFNKASI